MRDAMVKADVVAWWTVQRCMQVSVWTGRSLKKSRGQKERRGPGEQESRRGGGERRRAEEAPRIAAASSEFAFCGECL